MHGMVSTLRNREALGRARSFADSSEGSLELGALLHVGMSLVLAEDEAFEGLANILLGWFVVPSAGTTNSIEAVLTSWAWEVVELVVNLIDGEAIGLVVGGGEGDGDESEDDGEKLHMKVFKINYKNHSFLPF